MELTKDRQEEILRFTQELIRCPGFSGDEAETAAAVTRQMKKLEYDKVEVDRWGNVIGTIYGANPGPTIVFDGHMDVVPIHMPNFGSMSHMEARFPKAGYGEGARLT
jgi:acetylornithine deacetylase/succinyl-diaminopimelate desuccinylase-like protein